MARRRRWSRKLLWIGVGVVALALIARPGSEEPSAASQGDIPDNYRALYVKAGSTCPNLDWALLAGVGKVETDHGRSPLPGVRSGANSAGAMGPMQFLGSTWRSVRAKHPDVGPNVYDPNDAIPGAAHYLCDEGVRSGDIRRGVFAYNHANWYVDKVLKQARAYR